MKIKKLDLLIAIYIGCICIAELMGGKVFQISDSIQLFGNPLGTSVAVFLVPFIYSINDVIVEVHGKKRMQSILQSSLIVIAFIFLFSSFATWLPTAERSFISDETYKEVFHVARRVAFASLLAFTVAIFLDIVVFTRLRNRLMKYGLWFRNNLSNFISQFIDTTVFIYLAYFSFIQPNHDFLWSIIIPYWFYKCLVSVLITPFVYLGVKWLKNDTK